MHERLFPFCFLGKHSARLHIVLTVGARTENERIVRLAEKPRFLAGQVAPACRVQTAVALDAVTVPDRLYERAVIDDFRVELFVRRPDFTPPVREFRNVRRAAGGQRLNSPGERKRRFLPVLVAPDAALDLPRHHLKGGRHALKLAPLGIKRLEVNLA